MRRLMLNCTFFVQLLYGIFSIFFDYFYLFGTPMVKQKSAILFFLKGVQKSKNVYINNFFQILELKSIRKSSFNHLVPFFLVNYTVINIRCSVENSGAIE